MLDIECPDGDPNCMYQGGSGAAAASDIQTRMWDWLHTVEQATGKKPIIYTFGSYFSGNGIDTTGLQAYPLDIADIVSGSCFSVPAPWSTGAMWQYSWTGTVAGISGQVDRDKFLGNLADLQAFAQGGASILPHVNGNDALTAVNWPNDGHVELFLRTTKGTAQHVYSNGNADTWTQVYDFPGTASASCGLASVMWPTSSWGAYAELFDPMPGADVQHLYFGSSGWTSFADFGGPALAHVATVVGTDGHAEVYGLAPDGSVQAKAWDLSKGGWGAWQSLGGKLATGVAPVAWTDGHLELFATDAQGAAWHAWTSGGKWGGWVSLGGQLASRPVPVRWPDGHVEIYARGLDGHTYASVESKGTWSAFAAIESQTTLAGDVSAVLNPPNAGAGANGNAELFARTPSGQVVHMWGGGQAWNTWTPLGTQTVASDPLGWVRADGHGEVFAVDAAGNVVKSYRDGTAWGAWAPIASGIDACVAAAPVGSGGPGSGEAGAGPSGDEGGASPSPGAGEDAGGGDDGASPSPGSSGGCGCHVGGASRGRGTVRGLGSSAAGLLALALALVARRRRHSA